MAVGASEGRSKFFGDKKQLEPRERSARTLMPLNVHLGPHPARFRIKHFELYTYAREPVSRLSPHRPARWREREKRPGESNSHARRK